MCHSFVVVKDRFIVAKGILAAANLKPLLCSLRLRNSETSFTLASPRQANCCNSTNFFSLGFSITLLDFPSNPIKLKQIGD